MVTVGYERIHGLREKGQRRGGWFEASKSRTFNVPVKTLFNAFANPKTRQSWLPVPITVRTKTPHRLMRVTWEDGTLVQLFFASKGPTKSAVALQHQKLPDRAAAEAVKTIWGRHLSRLAETLS
jgi:uncharacterized protein YndB with AHSA1/START domain